MTYQNARRAGLTEHGKIERLDAKDARFSMPIGRGYRVKSTSGSSTNRAEYRRRMKERGFLGATVGAAYRRVRSLRTLGLHPAQTKEVAE